MLPQGQLLETTSIIFLFIFQYYELMKTEEIPYLEGSKFAPGVVKDIAQNILSFLKSNAAKEGHTYWLFKGDKKFLLWYNVFSCYIS